MSTSKQVSVPSQENLNAVRLRGITRLKPERVESGLRKLPKWRQSPDGRALVRTFKFAAGRAPLAFTELVLELAAKDGQQPSLTLTGGSVECRLTTEECGGISTRDFELARKISVLG